MRITTLSLVAFSSCDLSSPQTPGLQVPKSTRVLSVALLTLAGPMWSNTGRAGYGSLLPLQCNFMYEGPHAVHYLWRLLPVTKFKCQIPPSASAVNWTIAGVLPSKQVHKHIPGI